MTDYILLENRGMNIFWNEEDLCPRSVREQAHTSVQ